MDTKQEVLEKLKAFISEQFLNLADSHDDGGCPTCGYGATKLMSCDGVREAIDKFKKHELYKGIKEVE